MQAQRALLNFTESEKKLGERLLGIAMEIDRIEGYSEPHAVVMAVMAEKLALRLGMHGSDLTSLKYAALAHDLGERAMKRNYLLRPDAMTWEETLDLWRHPILGEQAAAEMSLPRHSQLLIRWHHEWWNGLGYPDCLAGESIPIGARILRLVDTWFALRSKRPHREAFDEDDAIQTITDRAGLEFDTDLVRAFLNLNEEERSVRPEVPEAIIPETDTFTILTPEGLQTAVIPHQLDDSQTGEVIEHAEMPVEIPQPVNRLPESNPVEVAPALEPMAPPTGSDYPPGQASEAEPAGETAISSISHGPVTDDVEHDSPVATPEPAPDRNEG